MSGVIDEKGQQWERCTMPGCRVADVQYFEAERNLASAVRAYKATQAVQP